MIDRDEYIVVQTYLSPVVVAEIVAAYEKRDISLGDTMSSVIRRIVVDVHADLCTPDSGICMSTLEAIEFLSARGLISRRRRDPRSQRERVIASTVEKASKRTASKEDIEKYIGMLKENEQDE